MRDVLIFCEITYFMVCRKSRMWDARSKNRNLHTRNFVAKHDEIQTYVIFRYVMIDIGTHDELVGDGFQSSEFHDLLQ